MLILGIDTSTSAIGVGLSDGDRVLGAAHRIDARGHTEHLAPLLEGLLADTGATPRDLTDVVVGTGPGRSPACVSASSPASRWVTPSGSRCTACAPSTCSPTRRSAASAETVARATVSALRRRRSSPPTRAARRSTGRGTASPPGPTAPRASSGSPRRPSTARRRYPTRCGAAHRGARPGPVPRPVPARASTRSTWMPVSSPSSGRQGVRSGAAMPVEPLYLRRPDALTTAERGAGS